MNTKSSLAASVEGIDFHLPLKYYEAAVDDALDHANDLVKEVLAEMTVRVVLQVAREAGAIAPSTLSHIQEMVEERFETDDRDYESCFSLVEAYFTERFIIGDRDAETLYAKVRGIIFDVAEEVLYELNLGFIKV